jgi:hypothetical protein
MSFLQMNGPAAAEGDKIWERSWSVDEIRKGAANWSLAGDAGVSSIHFPPC